MFCFPFKLCDFSSLFPVFVPHAPLYKAIWGTAVTGHNSFKNPHSRKHKQDPQGKPLRKCSSLFSRWAISVVEQPEKVNKWLEKKDCLNYIIVTW